MTAIGRYRLVRQLAVGGMAEIYLASATGAEGFSREVCLKLVARQYSADQEFRAMFANEALIAGRIRHKNIVAVFDFDHENDLYYIAMEYIEGRDLKAVMSKAAELSRPIPWPLCAKVACEAAQGLSAAHRFRMPDGARSPVVHRDVSPHNILLSFSGEVKVTDFGIAKLRTAASFTREGTIKGKLNYMSPEQAAGEELDPSSDVYSLGVVLWETLTGKRLFSGDSDIAVLRMVRQGKVEPPSSKGVVVPATLEAVLMKALSKDRSARYRDGGELADALDGALLSCPHVASAENVATFMNALYPDQPTGFTPTKTDVMPDTPPALELPKEQKVRKDIPAPTLTIDGRKKGRKVSAFIVTGIGMATVAAFALILFLYNSPQSVHQPIAADMQAATDTGQGVCSISGAGTGCVAAATDAGTDTQKEVPDAGVAVMQKAEIRYGKVSINANPWGVVYFRGKELGTTPLNGVSLPEGVQRLTVRNPELGAARELKVNVKAGEEKRLTVDLAESVK